MQNTTGLHIVAFDVPFPADYGGVIDIFYKIKSLHAEGVRIHLHAFQYGRAADESLLQYCEKVYYYPRSGWKGLFSVRPYIVASRDNWQLLENLRTNSWPILFEGLHTCFFLNHKGLAKRRKIVRLHNVEHDYYEQLANSEGNIFKRTYFKAEAIKLKWFEAILAHAQVLLPISSQDLNYFQKSYPTSFVHLANPWVNASKVNIIPSRGEYLLYHGNLSVQENNQAALLLVQQVFARINFPFVIAGKNPSTELAVAVQQLPHGRLVANPDEEQMQQLIAQAHLHMLYTNQGTGIKLKLFNALYHGRFCVVNDVMLSGIGPVPGVVVANRPEEIVAEVSRLLSSDFDAEMIKQRADYFSHSFNNRNNTIALINLILN